MEKENKLQISSETKFNLRSILGYAMVAVGYGVYGFRFQGNGWIPFQDPHNLFPTYLSVLILIHTIIFLIYFIRDLKEKKNLIMDIEKRGHILSKNKKAFEKWPFKRFPEEKWNQVMSMNTVGRRLKPKIKEIEINRVYLEDYSSLLKNEVFSEIIKKIKNIRRRIGKKTSDEVGRALTTNKDKNDSETDYLSCYNAVVKKREAILNQIKYDQELLKKEHVWDKNIIYFILDGLYPLVASMFSLVVLRSFWNFSHISKFGLPLLGTVVWASSLVYLIKIIFVNPTKGENGRIE